MHRRSITLRHRKGTLRAPADVRHAVAALVLVACGGGDAADGDAEAGARDGDPTTRDAGDAVGTDADVGGDAIDAGDAEAGVPEDVPDLEAGDTRLDAIADLQDLADLPDEPIGPPRPRAAVPISGAVEGSGEASVGPSETRHFDAALSPPAHPFMASGPVSNIHNDAWMTDAYPWAGPVGERPVMHSNTFTRVCGTTAFDVEGRVVSVCVGIDRPRLYRLDPRTLGVIAQFDLPLRTSTGPVFTDFGSGGYFYLDEEGRAVVPTTTREIWRVRTGEDGASFEREATWDLTGVVDEDDSVQSAVPDFSGRIWFVSRDEGVVGFVDPSDGSVHAQVLGEAIANSFAVDADGGVYIASAIAMYRYDVFEGEPSVTWRHVYDNTGEVKPGQVSAGTGTTPTLLPGGFVAITDNADPIQVVVYRTAPGAGPREVCEVPVFGPGASATENSLVGVGQSLFVENNHGYLGPTFDAVGPVTAPGVARVDLREDGSGCDLVWTRPVMAPTSVPKLSLATGLLYVISRPTPTAHDWAWTGIDVDTGDIAFSVPLGTGFLVNNNYAGIAIGSDGTAYVGVIGGIVSMRDGE